MDVWRITVAALRRWYILLPLLALTGFAAYIAGNGVQPEYDATGSAMVVPGQVAQTVPNPYGNVEDANAVLGIVLSSPETRNQIAAQGLSPSFEVVALTRSTISNFSVRADTPDVAIATGDAIFDIASAELQNRQEKAGVPVNERYTLDVVQAPALTAMVTEGKVRNMAIIGLVGAALSLLAAVLFDDILGLLRRRRIRKQESRSRTEIQRSEVIVHQPEDGPHNDEYLLETALTQSDGLGGGHVAAERPEDEAGRQTSDGDSLAARRTLATHDSR